METRKLIGGMAVALGLIALWYGVIMPQIDKKHPEWAQQLEQRQHQLDSASQPSTAQTPTSASTSQSIAATGPTTVAGAQTSATGPAIAAAPTGLHILPPANPATAVHLGSAVQNDPNYVMQIDLNPLGGGIDAVTLNRFKKTARGNDPYVFQQPYIAHGNTEPLATRLLTINGTTLDVSGAAWELASSDSTSATYTLTLADGSGPLVQVMKTFHIYDRNSTAQTSQGYEVSVDYAFKNLSASGAPVAVKSTFNGPTLPPKESDRPPDRQVMAGYKDGTTIAVVSHPIENFEKDKPEKANIDLTHNSDKQPAVWAGASSVYFSGIVLPQPIDGGDKPADYINKVSAEGLDLADPDVDLHQTLLTFETTELKAAPGQTVKLPLNIFFGPKQRELLNTAYYSSFPRDYNLTLVTSGGWCGFLTSQTLINMMVWLLTAFHMVLRDWGLAIIGLVCIVRLILHPITKRSQISMSKMQKMGPEMERLKKKYADDKDALNRAMWEFQKEQGLTPILGCLPMFLQMPIWIALWSSLQSTFELRHAPFLWGFTWIKDLAKPDYLVQFSQPVHLFFFTIRGINLLPLLMGAVMFFQQKYFTPKPVAATPEQAQQQKMMQWMTLLFPLMLYSGPSGLNLYILTSTTIGMIESKVIRDHIKQREEAEKEGRVFVPTKPTRASRRGSDAPAPAEPKKGGIMGWIADLQQRAEQMRGESDRRGDRR